MKIIKNIIFPVTFGILLTANGNTQKQIDEAKVEEQINSSLMDYGVTSTVAGVLRQPTTGTNWMWIDDVGHAPIGFLPDVTVENSYIYIRWPTWEKVGALSVTPDESLSLYGVTCGASVDTAGARIYLNMPCRGMCDMGELTVNASSWLGIMTLVKSQSVYTLTTRSINTVSDKEIRLVPYGANPPTKIVYYSQTPNSVSFVPYRELRGVAHRNRAGNLKWETNDGGWISEDVKLTWEDGWLKCNHPFQKDLWAVNFSSKVSTSDPIGITVSCSVQNSQNTWFRFLNSNGEILESLPNDTGVFVDFGFCYFPRGKVAFDAGTVRINPALVKTDIGNIWVQGIGHLKFYP